MTASLNPYITKFDADFDAEKSMHYRMTIQFSLGGLSFALLDAETQTLVALECYQSDDLLADSNDLFRALERALESKGLNTKDFNSVTCLIDNRYNTIVPETLFNEADKAKYLEFVHQIPDDYIIASEKINVAHCVNVVSWPKTLQDKILNKWKHARITHSSSIFIDSVMHNETKTGVFVHVHNRDFDLVIKKESKLFFFNNFKFNTKDDFVYFLLFAMEQNGFSGQDTPITFTGLIRPASEIIELCGRYVRDLRFAEDAHELQVSKAIDEVPFQFYYIHYQSLRHETAS